MSPTASSGTASAAEGSAIGKTQSVPTNSRPARLPPGHQDGAREGPHAVRGECDAPRAGAAQFVPGDERSEHRLDRADQAHDHRELGDDRPQPRPPDELLPALAQIGEEPAARRPLGGAAHVEEGAQPARDGEGERVDGEDPAGPDEGDERAAQCGAADSGAVHGHPVDGEGLVGLLPGDAGQQHALGRRVEEGLPGAAERGEQHHLPDLRPAREHEDGEDCLRDAVEGVGRDHHAVARYPVGHRAADEQEEDQRQETGHRDESHVARAAPALEDRPRGGDQRAVCAEVGHDRGGGEQDVVAARPFGAAGGEGVRPGEAAGFVTRDYPCRLPSCQTDIRTPNGVVRTGW